MDVLTWNVQGAVPPFGSKDRIRDQVAFIRDQVDRPDLLLLNEVTTVQRELWHQLLADEGYQAIVDTLDWAQELRESTVPPHHEFNHVNGNLIAIHEASDFANLARQSPSIRYGPWDGSDHKDWDTNFPEKILNASVEYDDLTIDLWNIRTVPGSMYGEEKIKILENTYQRIAKGEQQPRILAGDLNAPDAEQADGTVIPWRFDEEGPLRDRWVNAELNILTGLEEFGMQDVFRDYHGYDDLPVPDISFRTSESDPTIGKRFDHLFASTRFDPQDCHYDHDGFSCSDHAPLYASFEL